MNTPSSNPCDQLNGAAEAVFGHLVDACPLWNCRCHTIGEALVVDAGVEAPGGLNAGAALARLCLGDQASITLATAADRSLSDLDVLVQTDSPVAACLGGQYAGWPVSVGDFFAMASGPMRMLRGKEAMLRELQLTATATDSSVAVGVLEADRLPGVEVLGELAEQCGVAPRRLRIAIAPSTSIAGSVQVVARSIETALHKLHALDFDVQSIVSASGAAPLPPPAKPGDTVGGIGRTNDAMLYGARVTLWSRAEDEAIDEVASRVPSENSRDHGRPFAEIFKDYGYDFYKVDALLFSPAVVTIHSLRSGRTWRHGRCLPDVLRASFGM